MQHCSVYADYRFVLESIQMRIDEQEAKIEAEIEEDMRRGKV